MACEEVMVLPIYEVVARIHLDNAYATFSTVLRTQQGLRINK